MCIVAKQIISGISTFRGMVPTTKKKTWQEYKNRDGMELRVVWTGWQAGYSSDQSNQTVWSSFTNYALYDMENTKRKNWKIVSKKFYFIISKFYFIFIKTILKSFFCSTKVTKPSWSLWTCHVLSWRGPCCVGPWICMSARPTIKSNIFSRVNPISSVIFGLTCYEPMSI